MSNPTNPSDDLKTVTKWTLLSDEAGVYDWLQTHELPSLDIAYQEAKRIHDSQFSRADALDVKASIIIAASGIVLAFLLSALAALSTHMDLSAVVLAVLAGLFAVLSIISGTLVLVFTKFDRFPSIDSLISKYMWWQENDTKYQFIFEFKGAFEYNKALIDNKIKFGWASLSLFLTCLAFSCFTLLYLLQKASQIPSY